MNFKEGDVVQLKSGGPSMTVKQLCRDGDLQCAWFTGPHNQQELKHGLFKPHELKPYSPPPASVAY